MKTFTGNPIGIIGGSGLKRLTTLRSREFVELETPFGKPSDCIVLGKLGGVPVAFLQRHGPGHTIPPSDINVRANVAALKHLGCRQLISLSAVGSLQEHCPPGSIVLIDQFIDRTFRRDSTYFGRGLVGHVSLADPTCERMRKKIYSAAMGTSLTVVAGGTYIVMEGPQFSTRAESALHRQCGGTVIGMTAMPEAKLAREAEMCYASIAIPTDFDCWSACHAPVTAGLVHSEMERVADEINSLLESACAALFGFTETCEFGCTCALEHALMTNMEQRDPLMQERLRYLLNQTPSRTVIGHSGEDSIHEC